MKRAIISMLAAAWLMPGAGLAQDGAGSAQVKRGEYLVTIGLCHDCHTPAVTGPDGPGPDMKRALSGHPQDMVIKAPASLAEPWVGAVSPTLTAWSGPW
ncbi:MAG: diheme cytochrome c-553, partial [Pseudomonadota bacterium]|nr:diheme cytochrome c-553 [Pseudomonadota bacterium]